MAAFRAIAVTILLFVFHVALSRGQVKINSNDYKTLMAVRGAIENRKRFPAIGCTGAFGCDSTGRVDYVGLRGFGLEGRIAAEWGNLTSLEFLDLGNNKLKGTIPSSIGRLKSLIALSVDHNQLCGSIPSFIGQLISLKAFHITNNYFTGPIIQMNGHPSCSELGANCLFGSSLPKRCGWSVQRYIGSCLAFCNATQVGGPCGGNGICSFSKDGKTRGCACNRGYSDTASKHTCKLAYPPPQRKSLRL